MVIHHIDDNHDNNSPENLQQMWYSEHSAYHIKKRGLFGKAVWKNGEHPRGMLGKKHSEISKQKIAKNTSPGILGLPYQTMRSDLVPTQYLDADGFRTEEYRKLTSIRSKAGFDIKRKDPEYDRKLRERCGNNSRIKYFEKISSIKYIGEEEVFDMEVEDNHNFVANNFIVHNSGKTYLAINIIKTLFEKEPDTHILIVVPKIVILENVWLKELYNNGFGPNKVGMFYNEAKEYAPITLTTMSSVDRLNLDVFDSVVFDEIHNCMTDRLMPIVSRHWKNMLGLSATVVHRDGRHWELKKAFSYSIYEYDAKHAMDDGIISRLKYVDVAVSFEDMEQRKKYEEAQAKIVAFTHLVNSKKARGEDMGEAKALLYKALNDRNTIIYNYEDKLQAVVDIVKENRDRKILIFNQRNDISEKLYWRMLDIDVRPVVINSSVPKKKQFENMRLFKEGEANVLLASMSLDEGMNIPAIDVGIILSGNATVRQMIQRAGRVLRKAVDKTHATIYQIYLKDSVEENQALRRSEFFKTLAMETEERAV
jgi:superfamily II DNA or RNA helicase